jgi:hypothetical protein
MCKGIQPKILPIIPYVGLVNYYSILVAELQPQDSDAPTTMRTEGTETSPKFRNNRTHHPEILGVTVQNLLSPAAWRPVFVHP